MWLRKLKTLDVYRRIPQDLTESTVHGAVISVICFLCLFVFFVSELNDFLTVKTTTEMMVDVPRGGQNMAINMNITLHKLPCEILSLDAQDAMGKHVVDVAINRKNAQGGGCTISGRIFVAKVPGNIHLSAHGKSRLPDLMLEHTIHHLSFGDAEIIQTKKNRGVRGIFHPLDGTVQRSENENANYEYYIQVVPTLFQELSGTLLHSYQFTVNSNTWAVDHGHAHMPAIFFRYELSPITVKFRQEKEGFIHFLVQVCAIVGGLFTVSSIIAAASTRIVDKMAIGKVA